MILNKQKISVGLSLILIFTMILAPIAQTNSAQAQEINQENYLTDENIQPQAAGVAIFFAGVLVGYIVDGAVIYTTGYSAGYWAAQGIGHVHNSLASLPSLTNDSYVTVYPNTGNLQICNGSGYCAIPTKLTIPK